MKSKPSEINWYNFHLAVAMSSARRKKHKTTCLCEIYQQRKRVLITAHGKLEKGRLRIETGLTEKYLQICKLQNNQCY